MTTTTTVTERLRQEIATANTTENIDPDTATATVTPGVRNGTDIVPGIETTMSNDTATSDDIAIATTMTTMNHAENDTRAIPHAR